MAACTRLVLYGDSVFLAGIRAELERLSALDLIMVEPGGDVVELIRSCNPRAVLFDLAAEQSTIALTLLRDQPHLLLIGMDPCSDQLLVLSGRATQALNISDLVKVIKQDESGPEPPKRKER